MGYVFNFVFCCTFVWETYLCVTIGQIGSMFSDQSHIYYLCSLRPLPIGALTPFSVPIGPVVGACFALTNYFCQLPNLISCPLLILFSYLLELVPSEQ